MTVTKDIAKKEKSRYLSPFGEMEEWFDHLWRRPLTLLGTSLWPETEIAEGYTTSPSVDIYEEKNDVVLKADLPGIKKEDVSVNLTENVLTISGEKKKEEKVEKEHYYRFERTHGSFCRRFQVPDGIDTEKIKANFKDGVLEVRLPKTEETKKSTRKISAN